ncbi:NAD(P)H-hydrate dehydratase [Chloroflexota bacterium]
MAKLVSVEQMQSIERMADKNGLSYKKMMENAGNALAKKIKSIAHRYFANDVSIVGLVGPGNNGGDTLIALSNLANSFSQVTCYLLYKKAEQIELIDSVSRNGGKIVYREDDSDFKILTKIINENEILLDGVLGTGIKLPLHDDVKDFLALVKSTVEGQEFPPIIIAVDCPSGVDNDTGESAAETISADFTVCMAAVKQGLLKLPAYQHIGELIVVEIGLTKKNSEIYNITNNVASHKVVDSFKVARPLDSHKGTFGTCMIVAGSSSYTGAALLAGKAAYRVGSGLVTIAIPSVLHAIIAGHLPEATWILLPNEMGSISEPGANVLMSYIDNADSLLIGCGLGIENTTFEFMKSLLYKDNRTISDQTRIGFIHTSDSKDIKKKLELPPLVIDADGLNLLNRISGWSKLLPENSILTPHPGEMSMLTGIPKEDIQKDRLNIARKFSSEWNAIVVLKGAFTVIASPGGDTTTIPIATQALARAGSGDVLAGMISGFLAQGVQPYNAAIAGAWYHAQAGLLAAEKLGCTESVIASDIVDAINEALTSV